jgi:hypothetical protein
MMTLIAWLALAVAPQEPFETLHDLIRSERDEAPWTQIPWMTSLSQARERAAREGRPLLLWAAGGGGHPLGLC